MSQTLYTLPTTPKKKKKKQVLKEGKNRRHNNYDNMKLGRLGSESWAERTTNIREWDTLNGMQCLRRKVELWNLVLNKSRSDKWHAKEAGIMSLDWFLWTKCFASAGLEAFMRSWMNSCGWLRNVGVLKPECFQPHHFLTWRQETGKASWSVRETDFMFKCNSMFLKIFKRVRE